MIPQQGWDISPGRDPYPCLGCHLCSQTHSRSKKITPGTGLCHVLHIIQRCTVGFINRLSNGKVVSLKLTKVDFIEPVEPSRRECIEQAQRFGYCGNKFQICNSCSLSKVKSKYILEEWLNASVSFMHRVMWFSGKTRHLNISKFDRWFHPLWSLWETKHRKLNYILYVFVFISIMWTFNGITSLRARFSFIIWNSDGCVVGKLADKIETHKSETQGCFTPFN